MPDRSDPEIRTLDQLKAATMACRECPIGEIATQSVIGEGKLKPKLMLVGEQPGDQEDLAGQPFLGPAGKVLEERAGGADLGRIVAWFDQGGALKVPGDERADLCHQGFAVVPGLLDLVNDVGLAPRSDHPRAVAGCELVLEGLAAQKRISRSEELGYTRARPERREPGYGKGGMSFG